VREYLPNDDLENRDRSMVNFKAQQKIAPQWSVDTDFTDVSDPRYFQDLNSPFVHSADFYMPRRGGLHYDSPNWMGQLRLQDWEVVDPLLSQVTRPYQIMPQLDFGSRHPLAVQDTPLVWDWHIQGTRFSRNGDSQGQRIDTEPGIGLDFHGPGYFLLPRVGYRYTGYELDRQLAAFQGSNTETPTRQAPIVSVDSGLVFERPLFETIRQTLEPRLFALYVPRRNQDDIPIFDTGETDFTFDRLFRTNRFNGTDRLGDARQLSASLGSRFIGDKTGREWAHAQIGQMFYFGNQKVVLPGEPIQRRSYSNTLLQLDTQPLTELGTHLFMEVNPDSGEAKQLDARMTYQPRAGYTLTRGYRRNEDIPQTLTPSDPLYFSPYLQGLWRPGSTIEELDFSAAVPVTQRVNLVGRWFHSLEADTDLEMLAGAEYRICCWAVRGVWRRYADAAGVSSKTSSAFYVEFELTGFTTLGDRVTDILGRNVPGYKPL
jgi:LPS-assembly protein